MTYVTANLPDSLKKSLDDTKVEYHQVGSSGLRVSYPILGAMTFGPPQAAATWLIDEEGAFDILKAAYDHGINTWDTSNVYSNGASEEILGKTLKKFNIPRAKVVLMTKCGFHVGDEPHVFGQIHGRAMDQSKDYVNQGGLTRRAIFKAVDDSLARLGTTYIDLLQIHRFDPLTPLEETMRALHDLVQSGKVLYIGASSMWATQFAQMQWVAEKNGWTKFISMQNYYNLCYREEEREMNRFCRSTGVGLLPWSPLFAGRLARPVGWEESVRSKRPSGHHPGVNEADERIINRVEEVAKQKGWPMSHVALTWFKAKGAVPIVGGSSVAKIEDLCDLKGKSLTEEDIKFLEEPYQARPIVGHT